MDDQKLLGRNEDEQENEINIVKAISTDIKMKFGKKDCARISLKNVGSKAKYIQEEHLRRTLKNWTQGKHISIQT